MDFRLTYTGPLPSDNSASTTVKHDIRRQLHPQLKQLWQEHAMLHPATQPHSADGQSFVDTIAANFAVGAFRFVPLVQRKKGVACRLDFLILRRHPPQHLTEGFADVDNRIKTLVDGLRIPRDINELPASCAPQADQAPFFVLMEDDRSLYDFSVTTDRWLDPHAPYGYAVVIMRATLKGLSGARATTADLLYR